MLEVVFLIALGLIYLVFASVQDIKKTEVANWSSFSLIIFALGFRFFFSLFSEDFAFFWQGLIGLGIFFILGNLLYYGRMFAGGDAKLMIALGTVIPFYNNFFENLNIFVLFFILFLFAGFFYGFIWSIFLAARNFKKFKKEFGKSLNKYKILTYSIMLAGLVLMVLGFSDFYLFYLGILIFILPCIYIHAKVVDGIFMVRVVKAKNLIEGDWLVEDLKMGNKKIKKSWEGLSKKDICLIQKYKKSVRIKFGIPFVPVFLISFIILIYVWFKFKGFF